MCFPNYRGTLQRATLKGKNSPAGPTSLSFPAIKTAAQIKVCSLKSLSLLHSITVTASGLRHTCILTWYFYLRKVLYCNKCICHNIVLMCVLIVTIIFFRILFIFLNKHISLSIEKKTQTLHLFTRVSTLWPYASFPTFLILTLTWLYCKKNIYTAVKCMNYCFLVPNNSLGNKTSLTFKIKFNIFNTVLIPREFLLYVFIVNLAVSFKSEI